MAGDAGDHQLHMPQSAFLQNHCSDEVGCTGFRSSSAGSGANEVILSGLKILTGAVVQLFPTISTANYTGKHIALSGSGRTSLILPKFLYPVEGFFIHNRIMGILENLPFGLGIFDFLFTLVGLTVGSEIDHVPQIFLPFQDSRNGAGCPVIRIVRSFSGSISSHLCPVDGRTIHLRLFQLLSNLGRTIPFHAPCEDLPDNGCCFIIDNPMLFRILRIFHVAIGRIGGQIFTGFTF